MKKQFLLLKAETNLLKTNVVKTTNSRAMLSGWSFLLFFFLILGLSSHAVFGQCSGEVLNISAPNPSQTGTTGSWTVPAGGNYKIRMTAKGAKGGNDNGGKGTIMIGEFIVLSDQIIEAIAGAPGGNGNLFYLAGGGGGGSGVQLNSKVLLVAGGGGGGVLNRNPVNASATTNGENGISGQCSFPGIGGVNGNGGSGGGNPGCGGTQDGGGGGGVFSPGGNGPSNISKGGGAGFNASGGLGGIGSGYGGGGFGGGGGSHNQTSGGGGGYSGGGGGGFDSGGGGGSINLGNNQNNLGLNNAGGQVIIECLGEAVFTATFTATQPVCANPTQGSLSIDLTGDNNGNTAGLEYAIVAGSSFTGTPTFTGITADPFNIASGFGTLGDADGETYTVRIRLKYNPVIYLDYTYMLTASYQRTWTGALGTDWNAPGNWNPACVPTAANQVIIPNVTNDPIINAAAVAKSVEVLSGAVLTINSGLTINGFVSKTIGGNLLNTISFHNEGTTNNNGTLTIGSTPTVGQRGIINQGTFNNSGGQITIDNTSNHGLWNFSGMFTNTATITIGGTASIGAYGIENRATFNNNAGGQITIDRSSDAGLRNFSGIFTNAATITIGGTSSVGNYGIHNLDGTFNNNAGGQIAIDRWTINGLFNNFGIFTNAATINIGGTVSVGSTGIRNDATFQNNTCTALINIVSNSIINNSGGNFTNSGIIIENASGNSSINSNTGIVQNLNGGTFTVGSGNAPITVAGTIWTGCADTDWNKPGNWHNGAVPTANDHVIIPNVTNDPVIGSTVAAVAKSVWVQASGSLTIQNGGSLNIDGFAPGVVESNNQTFSLLNRGLVQNNGGLTIGAINPAGTYGIFNRATFINDTGGQISIDRSSSVAIENLLGSFTNSATITIGALAYVGSISIINVFSTFQNIGCAALINSVSNSIIDYIDGNFTNSGTIIENASGNSIINSNTGIVQNLNGGTFTVGSGNAPITVAGTIWTGCTDTDWNKPGNWHNGAVPTASDHVFIPNVTNDPVIGSTVAAVAKSVWVQTNGSLTIQNGGSLNIDGFSPGVAESYGFTFSLLNQGTVQNNGGLTIGAVNAAGVYGIYNLATFYNNTGGQIAIDRTTEIGLYNNFGTFTNTATVTIGGTASVGNYGIFNLMATFNNNTGGQIAIDRTIQEGIHNDGTFNNAASMTIGGTASAGLQGISNWEIFNNNTGGQITINNTTTYGINNSIGTFTNAATITIGGTAGAGEYGINNSATFNNNAGGQIVIDRSIYTGLSNFPNSTFTNAATITIGANASVGTYGIDNSGTLNNNACGIIRTFYKIQNYSSITNAGLFTVNTASAHSNLNVVTNNGIIEYPQGNPIPNVTNNEIIIAPLTANTCDVINPAFTLGSPVDFSILGIFTDANASMPAGTYTVGTNTFTPTAILAEDTHDFFVKIQDGAGGCTRIVPWQLTTQNCCDAPAALCKPATVSLGAGGQATIAVADVDNGSTADCGLESITADPNTVNCSNLGTVTVTLTVTDVNNASSQCSATVTVQDNLPPAITCPNPVTVACTSLVPAVNLNAVSASDNCGTPAKTFVGAVTSDSTCANRKTVTRTYRATDGSGNSVTCTQTITVFDNVQPNFTSVPANVTVQCNSIPVAGNPTATDGCGGAVTITYNGQTSVAGDCVDSYTLTRQWTATDACGNTKTATQRIVVTDTQKPNFTNIPANVTVQCDAIPAVAAPAATDNCDTAVAVTYNGQTQTNGACPNAYTLTRRWTAADNCGNTRSVTQRIVVLDNGKPIFTSFPANTTIACHDTPPQVGSPTASDGCGSATVTYLGQTSVSGSCPGNYQIRRTWRATDACGNSTVSTQTIQVSDTGVPVFNTIPGPLTIECGDPLPPLVNPTASDACGGFVAITFLGNAPSGSGCAADYTVTRTWRADDLCGNSATTSQVITVLGNSYGGDEPPGFSSYANDWTRMTRMGHGFARINQPEEKSVEIRVPSVASVSNPATFALQPNPTTDGIQLDLTDFASESVTVSIHSDLGQLVWERRIPAVEELKLSISLREAGAAAGIYTVGVRSASGIVAKRVVLVE